MQIAAKKTNRIFFNTNEERLLYLATLYNGGLHLSPERVKRQQESKYFPRVGTKFNYASVCLEFYRNMYLAGKFQTKID